MLETGDPVMCKEARPSFAVQRSAERGGATRSGAERGSRRELGMEIISSRTRGGAGEWFPLDAPQQPDPS